MKLIAALKLLPTPEQADVLRATLARCNEAATWAGRTAFDAGLFRRYDLHKITYHAGRERFGLTAQAMVLVLDKVAASFKLSREKAPVFRPDGAQAYDDRIMRFAKGGDAVNLWTVAGRVTVPVVMGEHQRRLMAFRQGQADLCFVRGKWLLAATCDIPETEEFHADDWLGVDLGIIRLATDSDGTVHTGDAVERVRSRLTRRKTGLQRRGTRAAKRKLKRLAGKEARFRAHTNHVVSKAIVHGAERTGRGIALEDLSGIRSRVTAKRPQRARLHSWGFRQLREYIAYKAKRAGVPVLLVDPRNTSCECAACGCVNKKNRPDRATSRCIACGHEACADKNAAINTRKRALMARGNVTAPEVLAA